MYKRQGYASALIDEIYRGISLTARVLDEARRVRKAVDGAKSLQVLSQVADAQAQINGLVWACLLYTSRCV